MRSIVKTAGNRPHMRGEGFPPLLIRSKLLLLFMASLFCTILVQPAQAAFPTVQTTNTSVDNTATMSHTVNLPSGIVSGNLLIVVAGFKGGSNTVVSWPGGWTGGLNKDQGTNVKIAAAWRQADGTEGATITVGTNNNVKSSHLSYRITGHENPATQAPEA